MRLLKVSEVGASGPMPSFRNSALLEEIDLSHNNLTLGDAGAFDYCPSLLKVDLSYNSISASVFRFTGSTNVELVDISHNMIRGSTPTQWSELTSCKVMRVAHNLIEEPVRPLKKMTELSVLDISHNRVAWENVGPEKVDENGTVTFIDNDFIRWTRTVLPSSLAKADYSYNLLRQPQYGSVGNDIAASWNPKMIQFDVSHNFLWGSVNLYDIYFNLDVSHNEIGHIEAGQAVRGTCCDDRKLNENTMFSVAMRHQRTSDVGFVHGSETPDYRKDIVSIDDALNSTVDFQLVEFMPHYNAFEQFELPTGSSRYPFSCPTWFVADRTNDPPCSCLVCLAGEADRNPS
jgi:hypothetical protein